MIIVILNQNKKGQFWCHLDIGVREPEISLFCQKNEH